MAARTAAVVPPSSTATVTPVPVWPGTRAPNQSSTAISGTVVWVSVVSTGSTTGSGMAHTWSTST